MNTYGRLEVFNNITSESSEETKLIIKKKEKYKPDNIKKYLAIYLKKIGYTDRQIAWILFNPITRKCVEMNLRAYDQTQNVPILPESFTKKKK